MSKLAWGQNDTTGYFLPEDSQFRLKKLHAHMVFLSGLAQPRTHDEDDTGFGPEIRGDDLAVCLEVLAEQAERVLDEVTWPAERVLGEQPARGREQGDAREARAEVGEGVAANGHEDDEVAMAADVQDDDAGEATLDGRQADALAEAVGLQNDGEAGGPDAVADASDADAQKKRGRRELIRRHVRREFASRPPPWPDTRRAVQRLLHPESGVRFTYL